MAPCLDLLGMVDGQTAVAELWVRFQLGRNMTYDLGFGSVRRPGCPGCGMAEVSAVDYGGADGIDEWTLRPLVDGNGQYPAKLTTIGSLGKGKGSKTGPCDLGIYDMPFQLTITRQ